jgi:hypothetical protein
MAEISTEPDTAAAQAPAPRRPAARRAAKLDTVLAAAVDSARAGVLTIAPPDQVGDHVGASAEGERLVLHRFEAKLAGYRGWQWFATVARVPRGKVATVCEVGLLPSGDSLLAPEWVPWADRVRPEDVPQPAEESAEPPHGDDVAAAAVQEARDGAPEDAGPAQSADAVPQPAEESAEPPHGDDVAAAAVQEVPDGSPEDTGPDEFPAT